MTMTQELVARSIVQSKGRVRAATLALVALVALLVALELCLGSTNYDIPTVASVLVGHNVRGATYAIWQVRVPRIIAAVLAGIAFGIGGNTFQTVLGNPLASPDVIGISSGASTVAVIAIMVFGLGVREVSPVALVGGICISLAIFGLSQLGGFSEGKLVLIGLGTQALMRAVTSAVLLYGAEYDVPTALRWLSGSLSGMDLGDVAPLVLVLPVAPVVLVLGRDLETLVLGQDAAQTLGVRVSLSRAVLLLGSVAMIGIATSVTGPVACVMLLAGPIATRLVGEKSRATMVAAMVAIALMLLADLVGHNLLGTRFPVGVVTGILGAPYLLWLLMREGGVSRT